MEVEYQRLFGTKIQYKFCDICIRGIEKGFRPHTHFTKEGWNFIHNEFHKATGLPYDKKQLKNKWESLKKEYKLWRDLIRNETGLGWDAHKNTVAADDAWWEERIKVNANFANFKLSGVEPQLEEKYELMFSNIVATGEFAISPGCNVNVTHPEEQVDVEGRGDSEASLEEMFEGDCTQASLASKNRTNVDKSTTSFKKGKRQSTGSAMIARHLETLVGAVASRSNSRVVESSVPSMGSIVGDLKSLPGIDINSDMFMFTTEFLEDKMKREVYLELGTPELKLTWLAYHFTNKGPNKNL